METELLGGVGAGLGSSSAVFERAARHAPTGRPRETARTRPTRGTQGLSRATIRPTPDHGEARDSDKVPWPWAALAPPDLGACPHSTGAGSSDDLDKVDGTPLLKEPLADAHLEWPERVRIKSTATSPRYSRLKDRTTGRHAATTCGGLAGSGHRSASQVRDD